MNRREINTGIAGTLAALVGWKALAKARGARRTALYSGVGDTLTHYEVDVAAGTLTRRATLPLPSPLQYAWPHPSGHYIYASTSDATGGARQITGTRHRLCALRVGDDGTLAFHGAPRTLSQRPIHNSGDATGRYALTCYNVVPAACVHRINVDGTLGDEIVQKAALDPGIFPHQIRMLPGNRSTVLVTRGNNATATAAEDPGALKTHRFADGQLSPLQSVSVGGKGGLGYGPRHLDFHPTRPWAYVAIERQNQLHMHRLRGDAFEPAPDFIVPTTEQNAPGIHQVTGAIHIHPNGHVVYLSNRASGTMDFGGKPVFQGIGDNSIVVFAIDQATGEPRLIQRVDPRGFHVRSFTIDPTGTLLVAATMIPMLVRDGDTVREVPAGLSLFRIGTDGKLSFLRKYDVDIPPKSQQVWVRMLAV